MSVNVELVLVLPDEDIETQRKYLLLTILLALAPLVADCGILASPTQTLVGYLLAEAAAAASEVGLSFSLQFRQKLCTHTLSLCPVLDMVARSNRQCSDRFCHDGVFQGSEASADALRMQCIAVLHCFAAEVQPCSAIVYRQGAAPADSASERAEKGGRSIAERHMLVPAVGKALLGLSQSLLTKVNRALLPDTAIE
jgi:hypothetical protein